jgi:hypothetical protein
MIAHRKENIYSPKPTEIFPPLYKNKERLPLISTTEIPIISIYQRNETIICKKDIVKLCEIITRTKNIRRNKRTNRLPSDRKS